MAGWGMGVWPSPSTMSAPVDRLGNSRLRWTPAMEANPTSWSSATAAPPPPPGAAGSKSKIHASVASKLGRTAQRRCGLDDTDGLGRSRRDHRRRYLLHLPIPALDAGHVVLHHLL